MQMVMIRAAQMVLVLRRCQRILSPRTSLYIIPSLLWLVLIHVDLRNLPVSGTKTVYAIIIQSHLGLLTSLIALCIFDLIYHAYIRN